MQFDILNHAGGMIPAHAYAAMAAAVLGAVQFALPKGTPLHRGLGYLWVGLMALVALSSFTIHTIKTFGPFSAIHLLSLGTLAALVRAIRSARQGRIRQHKRTMILIYVFALLLAGGFTLLPTRIMHDVVFGVPHGS